VDSGCTCEGYGNIELLRSAVDDRIKESGAMRKSVGLLAESKDKQNSLYKCDACGQFWQGSRAWNWDNKTYLFKVPPISTAEWLEEQYIQPHELLIFNASIERVLKGVTEKAETCSVNGCAAKAIVGSLNCLAHHVQSLQTVRLVPQNPKGRWFPPYSQQPLARPIRKGDEGSARKNSFK
jgi:hypothetical protein